ncbi:glycosyltransferase family 2 protein [Frigoribacterium sp. CFBP 8751]|uniref:glycosyltransferase family 2 protein n=1 Tax=Frigoribacterium sp. CFBP 8751 TaxID=2775277 RepID=UPI00313CF5B5
MSVVMLAYGDEPFLADAVRSVLASQPPVKQLVLVDNGCTSDAVTDLPGDSRLVIVRPHENLGFAGGVNFGVRHVAPCTFIGLVNSDAEVAPNALEHLVDVAERPGVGIASGSIRLAESPDTINTVGNPVHVTGLSWAGGLGSLASEHTAERDVTSASGAALVLSRDLWDRLGGFDDMYFAYHEDVDLSWRTWQQGLRVVYVPEAVVVHHYEFSRNSLKMYLLEKNRLIFVKTLYGKRLRVATWLPVTALDVALTVVAKAQGWGPEKKRAKKWIRDNRAWITRRRREVQDARVVDDSRMAELLTARLDQQVFPLPPGAAVLQFAMSLYWRAVRIFV